MKNHRCLLPICLIILMLILAFGCQRDSKDPPDEEEPETTPELSGSLLFSGYWQDLAGIQTIELENREVTFFNNVLSTDIQVSGTENEFLFVDELGEALIANLDTGDSNIVAAAQQIRLAPNGRKFFYNAPSGVGVYAGTAASFGGVLFNADASYAAFSPDLSQVAYLTLEGLVIAKADNGDPTPVDFPSLQSNEAFALPSGSDFFPRWSSDGSMLAASVTVINTDTDYVRNVLIVVEQDGTLVIDISNGTHPIWGASNDFVYYISGDQIWSWNLAEETNELIAGGPETGNHYQRVNGQGDYIAFIRTDEAGLTSALIIDLTTKAPYEIVPPATNGVLSLAWLREPYCAEEENSAPTVTMEIRVNGSPEENPVITPADEAVFHLTLADADCNLAYGVAVYSTDQTTWSPLSVSLPAGSGCQKTFVDLPLPELPDGAYSLTIALEDICGARSNQTSASVTYVGFGDDDITDDDTADDDTGDDDTGDDDTSDDDTGDDDSSDDDTASNYCKSTIDDPHIKRQREHQCRETI